MKRCQATDRSGERHCALPDRHLCDHDFLSEPLTLGQALAWAQEARLQREAGAEQARKATIR